MPAASSTISASGKNVMPSPYERQRPRSTRAVAPDPARNSCTSRDFPTPAGPRSVNRCEVRSRHRAVERAFEELVLLRPPDHRRVEVPRVPFRGLEHAHEAVGGDGFRLALQLERFDGLDLDRVLDQAIGGIAQQHLAGRGRLLQTGRDVHRVAGHQPLVGARVAGHDLPGVHADARGEPDAVVALEVGVQRRRAPRACRPPHERRAARRPRGAGGSRTRPSPRRR